MSPPSSYVRSVILTDERFLHFQLRHHTIAPTSRERFTPASTVRNQKS